MTFQRGRGRRPDDWPSSHVRARIDLAERLDDALEPTEAAWLGEHLGACPACTTIASEYASQRVALRALGDRTPEPPRDLWARTAAAIESEARFRDPGRRHRGRRSLLVPYAFVSAAVAVAVIVGSLTSSQGPGGGGTVAPTRDFAFGSLSAGGGGGSTSVPLGATPVPVTAKVEWLGRDAAGAYRIKTANVNEVCPPESVEPCDTAAPVEDRPVVLQENLTTAFGSPDGDSLIVVNRESGSTAGTVSVVALATDAVSSPSPAPVVTPRPSVAASAIASSSPSNPPSIGPSVGPSGPATISPSSLPTSPPSPASPSSPSSPVSPTSSPPPAGPSSPPSPAGPSSGPIIAPSVAPTVAPSAVPSPSVAVSPSPDGGTIEIARDVVVVGQSAAYSPSGGWFAFTARPADDSAGPDIYVWRVGAARATPLTSDHRSVFGSWFGDTIVGSSVAANGSDVTSAQTGLTAVSFLLDPATGRAQQLPAASRVWRPSIDSTGRQAVYWTGTLRSAAGRGFAPDAGRLVLGPWSAAVTASAPPASDPSGDPARTGETTIAAGRMEDFDARWDAEGSHLAIWIADPRDPSVGRLSLYGVDPFDGRVDLKDPLLDAMLATAGFALADGKLVWAEPGAGGSSEGERIQVLAWTDAGSGQVQTVAGPVVVIR